jgi:hypothetical protein
MHVLICDRQGILSPKQKKYAENRLRYSLARFAHRINGVAMHLSLGKKCEFVKCAIHVSVEGRGMVSSTRKSVSSARAICNAIDATEPKVAWHVDWRSWLNVDSFATWMVSACQPFRWRFGFSNPLSSRRH